MVHDTKRKDLREHRVMKAKRFIIHAIIFFLVNTPTIFAFAPVSFFRPEDRALRLPFAQKTGITFRIAAECGCRSSGENINGNRRNVLQLYDDRQTALWMVKNPQGSVLKNLTALYSAALGIAQVGNLHSQNSYNNLDDRVRGYQVLTGKYRENDMTLMAGVKIPNTHGRLSLDIYAPVKYAHISDVELVDQTRTDDIVQPNLHRNSFVHDRITANLKQNLMQWGGLDVSSWRNAGWGDLLVMLDWSKSYTMEMKDLVKEMTVGLRGGISCPTGVKKDVDQALSMAFGNDDAWAFPLGATMEFRLWKALKLGCAVDWLGIHDKRRIRRLKTDVNQTEFLLLNKGHAMKHYGATWNIQPYAQLFHIKDYFSARIAYQYIAHNKDSLSVKYDSGFDNTIINTAHSLQPWRVHNMIFTINYDVALIKNIYNIQCSVFYKLPLKGKGIIDAQTVGGQLAVNF
jgi:hypothetical protein